MATWGANADQLEAVAGAVGRAADLLDANRVRLNSEVHHAPWHGHEADQFRREWDGSLAPRVAASAHFLRDAELTLRRNAEAQRQASTANGGAAAGSNTMVDALDALRLELFESKLTVEQIAIRLSFFAYVGKTIFDTGDHAKSVIDLGRLLRNTERMSGARIGPLAVLGALRGINQEYGYLRTGNYPDAIWAGCDTLFGLAATVDPLAFAAYVGFHVIGPTLDDYFGISKNVSSAIVGSATQDVFGTTADNLSVAQASEYAHRYDGVGGFFNMATDAERTAAHGAARFLEGGW